MKEKINRLTLSHLILPSFVETNVFYAKPPDILFKSVFSGQLGDEFSFAKMLSINNFRVISD